MADTTLPGLLDVGTHAARPAASAVGSGGLYSCTDHSLVYQTDGANWTTWASLAGTGSVATDAIWDAAGDLAVGTGANTAARVGIGASNGMILQRSAGAVAWGYPPFRGAKAYNSNTQTMNGSGTNSGNTILTFDSEEFDTDTMHDTSSATSRLTIPITGYWKFGFLASGVPPAAGVLFDIFYDGAAATFHGHRVNSDSNANWNWFGEFIANLTSTHYIEVRCNNPSASTFTIGHASAQVIQTSFWAYFLGV